MEETPHTFLFADLVGFTARRSSWRRLLTCPRSRSALEAKAA